MNFYDEKLKEIQDLIKEGKDQEAQHVIDQELAMPYLPQDFYQDLIQLNQSLVKDQESYHFTLDEMETMVLFGSDMDMMVALNQLRQSNLRLWKNRIDSWLTSSQLAKMRRGLLYLVLNEQGMMGPDFLEPHQQPLYQKILAAIDRDFFKEPKFKELLGQLLMEEALAYLPAALSDERIYPSLVKKGFFLSNQAARWYDYQVKRKIDEKDLVDLKGLN